jgi:DNA-binding CsgD family transcriptional regulator/tetratricopeptide (TPR) repeat protein
MTAIPSLPVRGRDSHLAVLDRALQRALSGRGSVTIVEGGPGMGKTRLLQAVWTRAAGLSFRMGRGMADSAERVVELAPLLEALFGHDRPLLNRSALSTTFAAPEQRFWLLREIETLLEEATRVDRLLIVLDDLHWADSGTAAALRSLPPRLAAAPIAWVIARRPGQGSPAVEGAIAELVDAGADMLQLEPLTCDAVAEIVADLLAAEPDPQVLKQIESINGNPFLLVNFVRGLQAEGIVTVARGRATLKEDRPPTRISDWMRLRLAGLPESAERVATTAASLGRRFTVSDLASISAIAVPDLVTPIRLLLQADVLAESDDRMSFVHDLVRDAVRASVPVALRRALDRRAADVLLGRGALPVEVATQLAASAEFGDDVAIATLEKATAALGATDPPAAAALAERALTLMPDQHPLRGPLVSRRAISLFAAGMGEAAKQFADTVLRQALTPEQEAQVRLSIASMFTLSPDVRVDNAQKALALPRLTDSLRAWLASLELHNLVVGGRTTEATEKSPGVQAAARDSGSREARFAAGLASAGLDYQFHRFSDSLARVDAALDLGTSEDARARLAHYFRGWSLAALDRFDEAMAGADAGVQASRRDRQHWALYIFETWCGLLHLQMGRLPDASAALEGRLSLGDASTVVGIIDAANVSALTRVRIHAADERGARDAIRLCERMLSSTAPAVQRHAIWGLAAHEMALGHAEAAHSWLRTRGESARTSVLPLLPHDIANDAELIRIGLGVGDTELVASTITTAEERARLNPHVKSLAACAHQVRGLANRSTADLAAAVPLMRAAKRPLALASTLEDLGRFLVEDGATVDGIDALDEALGIAVRIGANLDAARIRSRLRRMGIRRRILPAKQQREGWEALTPAEHQVATRVVDGYTNREISEQLFISPHTVNTHLRHVFDKLEIRSRVDLVRVAERRQ